MIPFFFFFDHTRKITHDLLLLIREPIAFIFNIHRFTLTNSRAIDYQRKISLFATKQWIFFGYYLVPCADFASLRDQRTGKPLDKRWTRTGSIFCLFINAYKTCQELYKDFAFCSLSIVQTLSYKSYNYVYD